MIQSLLKPKIVFTSLLILGISLQLIRFAMLGNNIWGDARYYYAYTRSWVIDQDIDFSNERLVDPFYFDNIPTPIGRVGNKYSIGTPVMWLPSFLFAHLISFIGFAVGLPLKPDGYGHIYRLFIGLDSVTYMTVGFYFAYRSAALLINKKSALLATATIALGSHLFYYFGIDPANSHPPSVFIASALVYLWLKTIHTKQFSTHRFVLLGLLTGLLTLIRNHDLIFALPILIWIGTHTSSLSKKLIASATYILATALAISPQPLTWQLLYGRLTSPYFLLGEGFDLKNLQIFPVLFSSNNGLLYTAPILILSLVGLYQLRRSHPRIAVSGLGLFLLQTVVLASWSGWWGGASFGGRMFLSLTPFFIIGLTQLYQHLSRSTTNLIFLASLVLTQTSILWFLLAH